MLFFDAGFVGHASDEASLLAQVQAIAGGAARADIERFLEGFPRRYLAMHSAAEIAAHFGLYRKLGNAPLQTDLKAERHGVAQARRRAITGPPGIKMDSRFAGSPMFLWRISTD